MYVMYKKKLKLKQYNSQKKICLFKLKQQGYDKYTHEIGTGRNEFNKGGAKGVDSAAIF